jgi:hypothetical protein
MQREADEHYREGTPVRRPLEMHTPLLEVERLGRLGNREDLADPKKETKNAAQWRAKPYQDRKEKKEAGAARLKKEHLRQLVSFLATGVG